MSVARLPTLHPACATIFDEDSITVLHSHGPLLAKRITSGGIQDYDDARLFDVYPMPVDGLDDIQALLQRLLIARRCCAIRGELIDRARRRGVRRLLHADADDPATFQDVARQWLALDVERIERPADVAAADLAACARIAIQWLPAPFQRARCIVQASACHGIKSDIRLRLWFWLSRPALGGELGRWLADVLVVMVDPACLRAVQPIYTAAAVFQDGIADPLPHRLHVLAGTDAVEVPSAEALAPPPRPRMPPPSRQQQSDRYVDAALVDAARSITRAANGNRHQTLMREGASLLRFVPDRLTARDFADVLDGAGRAAGLDQEEIDDAIGWLLARENVA
jgi:hypothetical protein